MGAARRSDTIFGALQAGFDVTYLEHTELKKVPRFVRPVIAGADSAAGSIANQGQVPVPPLPDES